MSKFAAVLFDLVDDELDRYAQKIRGRVFSVYKDMPWKHEQYQQLQPLVRHELDELLYSILGIFDNVGSILPEKAQVLGYRIKALPSQEVAVKPGFPANVEYDEIEVRLDNDDYCEMWMHYLAEKASSNSSDNSSQPQ